MKLIASLGALVLIISLLIIKPSTKNNVCKTFEDYYTNRDENQNCHHNPDAELTTPEIIRRWGYPVETHRVTTEDGYILTLFRIPRGKTSSTQTLGKPVLLQHGHKSSSKGFVITGEKSLAFILANEGYDVWLGNTRGSVYSNNHTHLNDTDIKYWDFSFHELGIYDVAAKVDYVSKFRKQKIIYIGHSLGTTIATVYNSIHPDAAERNVKIFIKLAPFLNTKGISLYAYYALTVWSYVVPYVYKVINGQDRPHSDFSRQLWNFLCYPYPFQMKLCHIPDMWSIGYSFEQMDPETFPITLSYRREIASAKTTTHLSQMITTEQFNYFDYGAAENIKRYGSAEPPPYNISNMRVPVYLIYSANDGVSPKKGIEKFYASLPEHVKSYGVYEVDHDGFNHADFLSGKDVVPLLYNHLIKFISNL